jgi:hypothetical protein
MLRRLFYYLKRCCRRKEFAAGGCRVFSKHPNKFGQHQTARAAKDAREPSEIASGKEFILNEIASVVAGDH